MTTVPATFDREDAVEPVGAAGASEAHSDSHIPFMLGSDPRPLTDHVKAPSVWTQPDPAEDQIYPPVLPIAVQALTHHTLPALYKQ